MTAAPSTSDAPKPSRSPSPTPSAAGPVQIVPPTGAPSAAWRRVADRAPTVAPQVSVLAGTLSGDSTLRLAHRSGPANPQPLASMVKLFVLVAVAEAVRSGTLRWSGQLTLQATDAAAGSGSLIARPAGSRVTVQEAARLMMQVSDNTATDLLIRTLGQDALAKAVASTGNAHPDRLKPLITIREDMWLEWSSDPAAVAARRSWPGASTARRTELLKPATAPGSPVPAATGPGVVPRWQSGLGYFATPEDIARAHITLHRLAQVRGLEPLHTIRQVPDTGIRFPAPWRNTAFKGGTVVGVQTGSWYAESPAGDQVLVVMAASSGSVVPSAFNALAQSAADKLAR
nr:serine hydrolase [Flexivirga meconopsidis]